MAWASRRSSLHFRGVGTPPLCSAVAAAPEKMSKFSSGALRAPDLAEKGEIFFRRASRAGLACRGWRDDEAFCLCPLARCAVCFFVLVCINVNPPSKRTEKDPDSHSYSTTRRGRVQGWAGDGRGQPFTGVLRCFARRGGGYPQGGVGPSPSMISPSGGRGLESAIIREGRGGAELLAASPPRDRGGGGLGSRAAPR